MLHGRLRTPRRPGCLPGRSWGESRFLTLSPAPWRILRRIFRRLVREARPVSCGSSPLASLALRFPFSRQSVESLPAGFAPGSYKPLFPDWIYVFPSQIITVGFVLPLGSILPAPRCQRKTDAPGVVDAAPRLSNWCGISVPGGLAALLWHPEQRLPAQPARLFNESLSSAGCVSSGGAASVIGNK